MTSRKYHSPRRSDLAAQTRDVILNSACALFLERGYAGVTIGEIAQAANVAVPTVYSSAGSKSAILLALLEPALTEPAIAEHLAAVTTSEDPCEVIELTARGTRLAHERHWDLVYGLFYRDPPGELAVKTVLDRGADDFVQALTHVAARLGALDSLPDEVDEAEALDVLWFHFGPHAWTTLVGQRSWSFDRAQAWTTRAATRALSLRCRD
ncbi:TetR/AcrR family transcriptional regulator [Streptomyces sp. NPDC093065]|uniref:TetR/AcrR family transcriptional regulator n=1 Tax=Streptomyces sp. NPDC093065 TaxID=3366021 RepID=UPI00381C78CC